MLAPAITRMQCMGNPYRRVKDGEVNEKENVQRGGGEAVRKASFWWSWGRRKGGKKRGESRGTAGAPRRRWRFRVSKLRIRMLSPAFWLKKLRDSYINMMLTIEQNAPADCSGMVSYPSYISHPHYPGGGAGGGAWVWPTFSPPVVF